MIYPKKQSTDTIDVMEGGQEILYMDLARLIGFFDVMDRYFRLRLKDYNHWLRVTTLRFVLTRGGEITPTQLAKIMLRSKNNISSLIRGLEKDGLINRIHSNKDHRKVIIKITPRGAEFAMDCLNKLPPLQEELRACMDEGELSTLVGLSRKLRLKLIEKITGLKSQRIN